MITILYAAILGIFYVGLITYVVHGRYKHRVGLGDGGIPDLTQRIRIHGNFAEHVPFALLLIFLVDFARYPSIIVHVLGITLVVARVAHAIGIASSPYTSVGRFLGTVLTMLVILASALLLLWMYLVLNITGF